MYISEYMVILLGGNGHSFRGFLYLGVHGHSFRGVLQPGVPISLLLCILQIHQVSERRQVSGRSTTFDLLLEEHRKRRKNKKLNKLREEAGLLLLSGPGGNILSPER